ncbi:PREDICTED: lipoprotein lipase-like, partial [Ceratosolen solmsi marchali]|uniref:phospholipase A1 n=1 Tax=Ceratosolen solmsi marchali TaxID=326594 RepID=A0AAJ6YWR4_9HYME
FEQNDIYSTIFPSLLYETHINIFISIKNYKDAFLQDINKLVTDMDSRKPTVIYLHGYLGNVESDDVIAITSGYLQRRDHNVIAIDYRNISSQSYADLTDSAGLVGKVISGGINQLISYGISKRSIHLIGHSMGAQIAGIVGRTIGFKLSRITGLDPAGPNFNYPEAHLSMNDAAFVDTIHTDAGAYGTARLSATVQFYVNKGYRVQPGCPIHYEFFSDEDFCSHHRSWKYYAESLETENAFIGTYCNSSQMFDCGTCNKNMKIPMGYATPTNVMGTFYLNTRSQSPFGMQIRGAVSNNLYIELE